MATSMKPPTAALDASAPNHLTPEALAESVIQNLYYRQAKFPSVATRNDLYLALAYTIRDLLLSRWIRSASRFLGEASRTVCYMSAEFLMGPQLGNNLLALGLFDQARKALATLGMDLEDLLEHEEEPGLGNGGLGRLAACFMDSLATEQLPAIGYGLRYEFGIFDQDIKDGWQVERTDRWLRHGYPWEIARLDIEVPVGFGGHTERWTDGAGRTHVRWIPSSTVVGIPHDTPVLGYGVENANFLRLWSAAAPDAFDFEAFNQGAYWRAVDEKIAAETLTKVLYPNDSGEQGKALRLKQQYFLVSCSLKDMIRLYKQRKTDLLELASKYAVQLNDTHPALAIPELMRLLVDEHFFAWDEAWEVTTQAMSYTNHTLLPEALETWSLPLLGAILPRHLEIIFEINRRFLDEARIRFRDDHDRIARLSFIDERGEKRVRMANLACAGSHAVNGVAALHSELLKTTVLSDFHAMWPDKFTNVTNGVTPRRFVALANPGLTSLITEAIGPDWVRDFAQISRLEPFAEDSEFRARWRAVKAGNKRALAAYLARTLDVHLDPESMFDVQVKRIHEYKRQHLAILHAVRTYAALKRRLVSNPVSRTLIFAGKAAPAYGFAKLIIKLACSVAEVVNADPETRKLLRMVFVPDFSVKLGQRIYPSADLSEQISLAGKEASGTGNMKFAMNGALTIGTLDGANVEIRDAVGKENFFLFGMTADEVERRRAAGYRPSEICAANVEVREALDLIGSGAFSRGDRTLFEPIVKNLSEVDEYMVLADFAAYSDAHVRVDRAWAEPERWTTASILNVARMGAFSSDRSIREYAERIWRVREVPVGAR
ncbi:MAG: glycogen/starch/alpha-glucan phosphorylase [Deltaproteobacteria bacterium]|nr:glycogen/starch/alpha-glucan phosphorylase [Deltaproteobacteria bacterium]